MRMGIASVYVNMALTYDQKVKIPPTDVNYATGVMEKQTDRKAEGLR